MKKSNKIVEKTLNQIHNLVTERRTCKIEADSNLVRGVLRYFYEYNVKNSLQELKIDKPTIAVIDKAVRWLTDPVTLPCLILRGDLGNGKTTLAKSICATLTYYNRKIPIEVTAAEIESLYDDKLTPHEQQQNHERLKQIKESNMLFIDDIGKEAQVLKSWGNETHPVEKILSYRYYKRLTTILTTNMTNAEIAKTYGEYIADRMRETYNNIVFEHPSYR